MVSDAYEEPLDRRELRKQLAATFDLPGDESRSAALRRVEQERDELVDRLKQMTAFRAEAIDAVRRVAGARDLLVAELASARQELDAVRTARDNLDRELAEARATIRALTRTGGTT